MSTLTILARAEDAIRDRDMVSLREVAKELRTLSKDKDYFAQPLLLVAQTLFVDSASFSDAVDTALTAARCGGHNSVPEHKAAKMILTATDCHKDTWESVLAYRATFSITNTNSDEYERAVLGLAGRARRISDAKERLDVLTDAGLRASPGTPLRHAIAQNIIVAASNIENDDESAKAYLQAADFAHKESETQNTALTNAVDRAKGIESTPDRAVALAQSLLRMKAGSELAARASALFVATTNEMEANEETLNLFYEEIVQKAPYDETNPLTSTACKVLFNLAARAPKVEDKETAYFYLSMFAPSAKLRAQVAAERAKLNNLPESVKEAGRPTEQQVTAFCAEIQALPF